MKKGILFIALFAASFGFMQSSFAAPSMSANSDNQRVGYK